MWPLQEAVTPFMSMSGHPFSLSGVVRGGEDGCGATIDRVYFKTGKYAVYSAGERMLIQFSDDEQIASQQVKDVATSLNHLGKLVYLRKNRKRLVFESAYDLQVAEALRLGLEGQVAASEEIMMQAISDVTQTLARVGRFTYIKWAAGSLIASVAYLLILELILLYKGPIWSTPRFAVLAMIGGVLGAFFFNCAINQKKKCGRR